MVSSMPMQDLHAALQRQDAAPSHHPRLDAIRGLCERSPHCRAVALVGSFAQGKGDRISDLDLAAFVADGREAEFLAEVDALIGAQGVLDAYGQARTGDVAFCKYVYLDFSSCEFHAFHAQRPFRLHRPYLPLWDPHGHLESLVIDGEPPRHETFEPYPHGEAGLVWELIDCVKWLKRGRHALAMSYLERLGAQLRDQRTP